MEELSTRSWMAYLPAVRSYLCLLQKNTADLFCEYFLTKIEKLDLNNLIAAVSPRLESQPPAVKHTLATFREANEEEVHNVFMKSATKSCSLNPIPTEILCEEIGVMLHENMSLDIQIKKVCQACLFWLRNIRQIKRCLTVESTQALVQSLVLSRLDYCISLQRIQNSSARLITCTPCLEHIRPVLMQLHWLPVSERVQFKVLLLTCMAIQGLAPSYMCALVDIQQSQQSARSANVRRLVQPRSANKNLRGSCFFHHKPSHMEYSCFPKRYQWLNVIQKIIPICWGI